MKNSYIAIILIIVQLAIGLYSCNRSQKSKIELKFEEYVNKNFATPSDLIEIASIELEDSINMREVLDLYLNGSCRPDSIESRITEQFELMSSLFKQTPTWFKNYNKEYIIKLINSESSYLTLSPKWEYLKEEYEKIDSLNLIQKEYVIKARIKQNDKIVMREFYAIDYMIVDSLAISSEKILYKDLPQEIRSLLDALDSYMEAVRLKRNYIHELISFNNKQQQVSI